MKNNEIIGYNWKEQMMMGSQGGPEWRQFVTDSAM